MLSMLAVHRTTSLTWHPSLGTQSKCVPTPSHVVMLPLWKSQRWEVREAHSVLTIWNRAGLIQCMYAPDAKPQYTYKIISIRVTRALIYVQYLQHLQNEWTEHLHMDICTWTYACGCIVSITGVGGWPAATYVHRILCKMVHCWNDWQVSATAHEGWGHSGYDKVVGMLTVMSQKRNVCMYMVVVCGSYT